MESPEKKRVTVGGVLAPDDARSEPPPRRIRPDSWQRALWGALVLLTLVALTDLVVLWVPVHLGNAEWEFATFSQTVDSLPLLTLMVAGMVAVGLNGGQVKALRILTTVCWLMVLVIGGIALLYALNVPIIWQRAVDSGATPVLRKAFVKMALLSTCYLVLYGFLGVVSLRGTRHS